MFTGAKGYLTFLLGICLLATTIALAAIVYFPGGQNVVSILFQQISFSVLAGAVLKQIGFSGAIIGLGSFFTLAAFFTAVPSSGGFAGQGTRVAGLFFVQQTFFWPFVFILLLSPGSAVSLLPFIAPVGIVMYVGSQFIKDDLEYHEFADSKSGQVQRTFSMSSRRFAGVNALVLVIMTETFYIVKFDPTLSLFGWLFLLYVVFFAVLQIAFTYGLLFQLINAKNVVITTTANGRIEGYLVSRGEDHILIRTKDNERLLVPMSSVAQILLVEKKESPPQQPPALEHKGTEGGQG